MTPNPVVLFSKLVRPHTWTRRSSSTRSESTKEHWDAPYPGTYEYKPGRGWYLVAFDEDADCFLSDEALKYKPIKLPHPVTYCKLLHRFMFVEEYNERRRWERVNHGNGEVQLSGFFVLDDGITYVQCWDQMGNFQTGPYQRWCVDADKNRMRPMIMKDALIEGTSDEDRESRRSSYAKSQRQLSVTDVSARCSACSSPHAMSVRRPALGARQSSNTIAGASMTTVGTTITTPSSGIITKNVTKELDPDVLDERLRELCVG